MSSVRDWEKSLWAASYKSVPFFFESDEESGGRGLVIHQFPHRDDPFIEDLGEAPRYYEGTAYVHGDDADTMAVRLAEMLATKGPGTLVVPIRGPVSVHCETFKRASQRDKLGYAAFTIKMVRDGAASAFISVPYAQNLAFQSADRLAAALAGVFPTVISISLDVPDHVAEAVTDGLTGAVAALEAVRLSAPVDPVVSATIRDANSALFDQSAAVETTSDAAAVATALIANTRALADGVGNASIAQRAFSDLADLNVVVLAPAYLSPSAQAAAINTLEVARLARLAALTAWAEALLRRTYTARPDGVSARAEAAVRFEAEMSDCNGAEFAALYLAIGDLRGRVIEYLTRLIADLAPIITITASATMPSLYWAYRLYADPLRSGDLVARNSVIHPSFMPLEFQAPAS